jgi:hypothetical protein
VASLSEGAFVSAAAPRSRSTGNRARLGFSRFRTRLSSPKWMKIAGRYWHVIKETHQLGLTFGAGLFEYSLHMRTSRISAHKELIGNSAQVFTCGEQASDLRLRATQSVESLETIFVRLVCRIGIAYEERNDGSCHLKVTAGC